jgi:hypothetical protein
MDEKFWRGNLAAAPLPQLLFSFWERKTSGRLRIQGEGAERNLFLSKGDLALAEGFYSETAFTQRLIQNEILTAHQVEDNINYASENKVSFFRALIELGLLSPSQAWEILTEFWQEDLAPLFDWQQADYAFEACSNPSEVRVLAAASTPDFILRGIRGMKNFSLIESSLPADAESLQVLSPSYADTLKLDPHERYILGLLQHTPRLQDLYAQSQLGKQETKRVIFAFLQVGLAGLAQQKNNKAKPLPELSSAGLEKIWSEFNDKCSYIFKYISKEIGPVALNVLEKALDEVRAKLGPPLQGLELRGGDGRIEFKPFPLVSLNVYNEENFRNFVRLLNEILMAEVLAVKKTLGNAHEAAVVKNLERIGEPT